MATKVIPLSKICSDKKVNGLYLRRRLRASGLRKPGKFWTYPAGHRDLKTVRKLAAQLAHR